MYNEGVRHLVSMATQSVISNLEQASHELDIEARPETLKKYLSDKFPSCDDLYTEIITGKSKLRGGRVYKNKAVFVIKYDDKVLHHSYEELSNGRIVEVNAIPEEYIISDGEGISYNYIEWVMKQRLGINHISNEIDETYLEYELPNSEIPTVIYEWTYLINMPASEYKDVYVDKQDSKSVYYVWE